MRYPEEEIQELKEILNTEVREIEEAGYTYVYIRGLKMPPGCTPGQTDVLLCPSAHSGYTSRLFFKDQIQTPKSINWNGQVFVLGQQWYAFSFNNVQSIPLTQMVINHLRGMVA